jgi:hypothetical protein
MQIACATWRCEDARFQQHIHEKCDKIFIEWGISDCVLIFYVSDMEFVVIVTRYTLKTIIIEFVENIPII